MEFLVILTIFANAMPYLHATPQASPQVNSNSLWYRCDYSYIDQAKGFFKYHEIPLSWDEARLRCEYEGGLLVSPLTDIMVQALTSVANITLENTWDATKTGVWTGMHSKFSQGDFFSLEGASLAMLHHVWSAGEPNNNDGEENCIAIFADGSLADEDCAVTKPYLCFKENTPDMVYNECGTTDKGYSLNPTTGSCYKFHEKPRTWHRAYMTCVAEGGYLAVVNSDNEAKVLKNLYLKASKPTNVGEYFKLSAYIGFNDWGEPGEWRTIHGQTLEQAGYDKWSPGEPNNLTSPQGVGQACGGIYRTGVFDDVWCEKRGQFICEKEPQYLATCHGGIN